MLGLPQPLLRDAHSQHCLVCDELALDAQERVVAAWQRHPEREPWTQARIVSCAQSVLADRVRSRLSAAGLVARPERWLDQRSFLPHVDPTGRVLLVALIVSVGYYTCIPTAGGRVRLGPAVVSPLVDGVRRNAFASALTRAWPDDSNGKAEPDLAASTGHLAAALVAWRDARPEQYAALISLAEANRTVLSLDVAGMRSDVEFTHLAGGPAGDDVAEVVIEQRGRWIVETENVTAAGALLRRFLDRVRELARAAERPRSGVLAEDGELRRPQPAGPSPSELRMLLVEEAEKLAADGNGPAWLRQLRDRPAVVSALIDRAAEIF